MAVAGGNHHPPLLDPQLLMAARRGDSKLLKELLLLPRLKAEDDREEEDAQEGTTTSPTTSAAAGMSSMAASRQDVVVIVQVDPRRPHDDHAAAAAPSAALREDGVTMEGDTLLHVVAACGDSPEFLHCADMIVRQDDEDEGRNKMGVLQARNRNGDTPLHCAAAAGNADMIQRLVDLAAATKGEAAKELVEMQNQCGETALHQAIRATTSRWNKLACIDRLMAMDPELACIPREEGASPLYLAVSLGELEIATHLLHTSKGRLSYSGPHGRNVLHAAVSCGKALQTVLEWLKKDVKTTAEIQEVVEQGEGRSSTNGGGVGAAADNNHLLSKLTRQRDKQQKGSTPLHLAASLDGWPMAGFLFGVFPQVWAASSSATALLLDANKSMAYQVDDEGSYPVHVAAWCGSLDAVKALLQTCPDCATLRDGSERTFLHVAVSTERHSVVKHVCETPELSPILNAQDKNGDTALHAAVRAGDVALFNCLFRNRLVRLDLANKDGMTPLDLSYSMIPSSPFHYPFNPRNTIALSLASAGAPHGGGRPELFYERHMTKGDADEVSEKLTHATQATSIVAVLIATVTFASVFTLPGGYRPDSGDDSKQHADAAAAAGGTPVLDRSYAFNVFILADTLAFIGSTMATCTLVYAGVPAMDISIRHRYFHIATMFLQFAARSFVAVFALALYLVLAPLDHTTAVVVCVLVSVASLYGNMELWRTACLANTVCTRIGMMRRPAVWIIYARAVLLCVLVHFGSYVLIFGLPAIPLVVNKV